jgi:hypothetical protein
METLKNYSNANPFSVPDGYFEDLEKKIVEKTSDKQIERISVWEKTKPILAVAAGFLIVLSVWGAILNHYKNMNNIESENTSQYTEAKLIESVTADEMIEIVTALETSGFDLNIDISDDAELIIEEIEESSIIDAI